MPTSDQNADVEQLEYDRSRTGWELNWETTTHTLEDGTIIKTTGARETRMRPAHLRERCGPYTDSRGTPSWGDHRVTEPGTTCEQTGCHVAHHPDVLAGWAEPEEDFYERPGIRAVASSLEGWDGGGIMPKPIGSTTAWIAAAVALDALRDAGYRIVPTIPSVPKQDLDI
jgi:hypothetical protein